MEPKNRRRLGVAIWLKLESTPCLTMNSSFHFFAQAGVGGGNNSVLIGVIALVIGAVAMAVVQKLLGQDAKSQAKRMLEQAKLDAENLVKKSELEQKEKLLGLQTQFETDLKKQRDDLRERENQLNSKEQTLKQTTEDLKKQEKFVESNQRKLAEKLEDVGKKSEQYGKLITQAQSDLQRVTGLSKDEAKRQLMEIMEKELQGELGSVILKHEKKVTEVAQQKAQDILLTAMQRYASAQTAESTTSSIDIPNDEMKGRIIGREGRNIRAFEKASAAI